MRGGSRLEVTYEDCAEHDEKDEDEKDEHKKEDEKDEERSRRHGSPPLALALTLAPRLSIFTAPPALPRRQRVECDVRVIAVIGGEL